MLGAKESKATLLFTNIFSCDFFAGGGIGKALAARLVLSFLFLGTTCSATAAAAATPAPAATAAKAETMLSKEMVMSWAAQSSRAGAQRVSMRRYWPLSFWGKHKC